MTTTRITLGAIQLLLVFTLLGCARGAEDAEAAAARKIVRMGGSVIPIEAAHAATGGPRPHVEFVYFNFVDDSGLAALGALPHLRKLGLTTATMGDTQMHYLDALNSLVDLNIGFSSVGDAGLKHVAGLSRLERLCLTQSTVTDAGLKHLSGLTKLKDLALIHDDITDSGLQHLGSLTHLEKLDLRGTKVKGPGLRYLRTSRVWRNCRWPRHRLKIPRSSTSKSLLVLRCSTSTNRK